MPRGPDLDQHIAAIRAYEQAGFDELYIQQIGPNQDAFLKVFADEVLPQFSGARELSHSGG